MAENDDSGSVPSRAEEVLQVFKKGAEFTQELLRENERLRYRVLELEQQLRSESSVVELQFLKERLNRVEDEKHKILERIHSVEQENVDFANRYAEIEAENNLLANLYITTYQLHSTFNSGELVSIIEEVLLNLVGAEQFSLLLCDENGLMLQPLVAESAEPKLVEVKIDDSRIRETLESGCRWLAAAEQVAGADDTQVKAVIPLRVDDKVVGVIAIYRLLPQKSGFTELDEEIFSLLENHASVALCTAVLHRENLGKINFRQGFLSRS